MNQDGTSLSVQPTIEAHISQWPEEARLLDCVATNGVTSTQHPGETLQHPPTLGTSLYSVRLSKCSGFIISNIIFIAYKRFPLNASKIKALFLKFPKCDLLVFPRRNFGQIPSGETPP